ncbi:MAG: HAD family hydrolase [Chloroflexota bacterium]
MVIAFDADDTLWQNETLYARSQDVLRDVLAPYASSQQVTEALFATEMRNLPAFGYGIKSFVLSMIETAVSLSNGRIPANDIGRILAAAKAMTAADVELLPHVADTVPVLAAAHTLMIITKGDLLDQERKVARSGLRDYFTHVEVVSQKTTAVYANLLARHGLVPAQFVMVGNSLRSDILPVVEMGGTAVYIPYVNTWAHENNIGTAPLNGYHELAHMGELPDLLNQLL